MTPAVHDKGRKMNATNKDDSFPARNSGITSLADGEVVAPTVAQIKKKIIFIILNINQRNIQTKVNIYVQKIQF